MTSKVTQSLKGVLISWSLFISIVPIAFITGYSIVKYQSSVEFELIQRLKAGGHEVETLLGEYKQHFESRAQKLNQDVAFIFALGTGDLSQVKSDLSDSFQADSIGTQTIYDFSGKLLVSFFRENGRTKVFQPPTASPIQIDDEHLNKLKLGTTHLRIEEGEGAVQLVSTIQLQRDSGKLVGFIEQTIEIDSIFFSQLKRRMGYEFLLMSEYGKPIASTHSDLTLYPADFLKDQIKKDKYNYIELPIQAVDHAFLIHPISWGEAKSYLAIGVSKKESAKVLRELNIAFLMVLFAVIALVFIATLWFAKEFLRPIAVLVRGLEKMEKSDVQIELPIMNDTEIGDLTKAFNNMNRSIYRSKAELKEKYEEAERAKNELKATQAQLIQSAKMNSLGKLVAGVAHELNNPLGYVYSNLAILKEYTNKLLNLAQFAPDAEKKKMDFQFIEKDIDQLVSSCIDGSIRAKNVVSALKNFSRLDQSDIKQVDLNELLRETIEIVKFETKDKIDISFDAGKLDSMNCVPSQLNQVFLNVITNSIQSIRGKGEISIITSQIDGEIHVVIQDNGVGISPENLEHVFDPFFTTKEVGEGTGLGLSISYGIVVSHGGKISVQSKVGQGTGVTIVLPLKSAKQRTV
jgi:two-component system, NtrC family, sensor kinase